MGERDPNPDSSISYTVPQIQANNSVDTTGFDEYSLGDYFGLPIKGELVSPKTVNSLPFRAYQLIWNEWFRSEDLQNSIVVPTDDGPDSNDNVYDIRFRGKRHDYFTSALPWPVKQNAVPSIPLGTSAPVKTSSAAQWAPSGSVTALQFVKAVSPFDAPSGNRPAGTVGGAFGIDADGTAAIDQGLVPSNLYADLSQATGATLNAIRLAVATQQLLEKDARSGTRYTELLRAHFGVFPQDYRLQRPEYIGGGKFTFRTEAIAQTAPSDVGSNDSTVGELGASTLGAGTHDFSYSCQEHGYIIGLANVYADLTYQRGVHRMWTRSTRYDFYWPTFAFLGEQAVRNDEIFADGSANDILTFGYQERWAEYRTKRGMITGAFRSNNAASLDTWHLSQDIQALPTLGSTFIESDTPISRIAAAAELATGQQFLFDSVFEISLVRALPIRSVPGLMRF